jgi:putative FmdB family regulatory protein
MPIYEYQCGKCGVFEVTQRITEAPLKKCPTCKSKVERILSRSSFVLKGSGWYATDYAKKDTGGGKKADATPSADTKSGEKSGASSESSAKPASESKSASDKPAPAKAAD